MPTLGFTYTSAYVGVYLCPKTWVCITQGGARMFYALMEGKRITVILHGIRYALSLDAFEQKFGVRPSNSREAVEAIKDVVGE